MISPWGEVDEPHDREDERQAKGEQRVLRPEGERVDDLLDGVVHPSVSSDGEFGEPRVGP
jgi:hypothetical protein